MNKDDCINDLVENVRMFKSYSNIIPDIYLDYQKYNYIIHNTDCKNLNDISAIIASELKAKQLL